MKCYFKPDGEYLQLKCTNSTLFWFAKTSISTILFYLMQKTVSTKNCDFLIQWFFKYFCCEQAYMNYMQSTCVGFPKSSTIFLESRHLKIAEGWIQLIKFNYSSCSMIKYKNKAGIGLTVLEGASTSMLFFLESTRNEDVLDLF